MDRIKRITNEVLDKHKSEFGVDFKVNKKALEQVSIIRSKSLKNKIAGYITKFIKKEIREEKDKQARIAASRFDEPALQETQAGTLESPTASEEAMTEAVAETAPTEDNTETMTETTPEEKTEAVAETAPTEEKTMTETAPEEKTEAVTEATTDEKTE